MNQEKIGKLIAKLRKEKGLTQQQLGDMVGVGYRAVSKWETGLTLPDISIINELCEILGITSDELLKGELHKKESSPKTKRSPLIWLILIPIIIGIIAIIYIIKQNNKQYIYDLKSYTSEYYVKGNIIFKGNNVNFHISKIEFQDYEFNTTNIVDYRYRLMSNGKIIFGLGYGTETENFSDITTINELMNSFTIDYIDKNNIDKKELIDNKLIIEFIFIDENNNKITKNIECVLFMRTSDDSTN